MTPATDEGCAEWDWDRQVCLSCATRYMMNQNGQCIRLNDNCEIFNAAGVCTQCYKGYELDITNNCVLSAINQQGPSDLGCAEWDWDNQVCLQCSERFVFNSQGICVQVSDDCASFGANGLCQTCYKGYVVDQSGRCVLSQVEISGPTDLGCAEWNWDEQVCLKCSERFIFNAQGICSQVDDLCQTWNEMSGACTSCYEGYILMGDQCILQAPFCKTQDVQGNCQECYQGFVKYKNQCTPLSRIADLALYYQECCPEMLEELRQNGRLA